MHLITRAEAIVREFVENFDEISKTLRSKKGDETEIEIVSHTDSICGPCPKRKGLFCETQDKINRLDRDHLAALGLRVGDRLTWGRSSRGFSILSK